MAGLRDQAAILARCDAVLARALAGGIDGAVADAHRLPPDAVATGALAAALVMMVMRTGPVAGSAALRHLDGLLALADRNPPASAQWRRARSVAGALALLCAAADGRLADRASALAELRYLRAAAGDDPAVRTLFRSAEFGLGHRTGSTVDHQLWVTGDAGGRGVVRPEGVPRLRGVALDRLRRYTVSALKQPEPVVREAVEESLDVAYRFLVDGAPADAVTALDIGRGLLLARAGAGTLDPPEPAELQCALRALDVDALVHLVPARRSAPGWAVITPADGPASCLVLTGLVAAGEHRVPELDAVCERAWRVAIGPVLNSYRARHDAGRGRPPRFVLAPIGDLARVPWHAARRRDGTYAVELASFAQTVSARALCDSAAAPRSRYTTLWPVADPSPLTYMLRRYLTDRRRPAREAVRRARLWMLDPGRRVPPRMPAALRDQLEAGDPARVAQWGALVHWGQ